MRSAHRTLLKFVETGGSAELILLLDAPDPETTECATEFAELYNSLAVSIRVLTVQERDLGNARNKAVQEAKGEFVAFLDADDIWGEEWLRKGIAYLQSQPRECIAHPQVNVNFEGDHLWWTHKDCRDPSFDPSTFFITNHWTALALAKRSTFEAHPYRPAGGGFGFEDWEFNCRTLSEGVLHVVVPETVHFIRKNPRSMSNQHAAQNRIVHANKFFEQRWELPKGAGEPAITELGEWLTEEWQTVNEVEPELWPHPRELAQRPRYYAPVAPMVYDIYHRIRAPIPADTTHVIFFAGLGGGADLRAGCYADAIVAKSGKPCLVSTDAKSAGHPVHDTYEITPALAALQPPEQARVLQRLIVQLMANGMAVHIVNSRVAWMAVSQNPNAIASMGGVFASLYAYEASARTGHGGYAANGAFTACMPAVSTVITDNFAFKREFYTRAGWKRTVVAPTPVKLPEAKHKEVSAEGRRVLWASRIDWNKNLDLLFDIAASALQAGERILFDVAGDTADYYGFAALQKIKALPNVKWRGPFKDFAQLQPDKYDAFLFTSHKEGMPNVVLEAMAAGLPVITSPAGELQLCDVDEFPGVVVKEQHPEAWVKALKDVFKSSPNSRRWLKRLHTAELFAETLDGIGYFANITSKAT